MSSATRHSFAISCAERVSENEQGASAINTAVSKKSCLLRISISEPFISSPRAGISSSQLIHCHASRSSSRLLPEPFPFYPTDSAALRLRERLLYEIGTGCARPKHPPHSRTHIRKWDSRV